MLISEILEKTAKTTAAENMANRLADKVRNIWLECRNAGVTKWEETFFEDPEGVHFLALESFPNLVGVDYIFKWWGSDELDGLAGTLEVLWKVKAEEGVDIYKSWIRFADRDFVLGILPTEERKREETRKQFRKAFELWQQAYAAHFE